MEKNEIRAESIHFKDVKFRSSKELRDRLKTMPVFRDEYTVSDPAYLRQGMRARGIPLSGDEPFYPPEEVYVALRMLQKQGFPRLAAAGRGRETAVGKARHFPSIL